MKRRGTLTDVGRWALFVFEAESHRTQILKQQSQCLYLRHT